MSDREEVAIGESRDVSILEVSRNKRAVAHRGQLVVSGDEVTLSCSFSLDS